MLTDIKLESYFETHQLPVRTRDYIRRCIQDPSRLVGTSAVSNVISGYPSYKTGLSIQTESRTVEHPRVLELEFSKSVVAFFDQPVLINVDRTSKKGKKTIKPYTSDLLVLDQDGPWIEELKMPDEAEELVSKYPADWVKTESGYMFLPAQRAFSEMGIGFRVMLSSSTNQIRADNLKLLLQARKTKSLVTDDLRTGVERVFADQAWFRFSELSVELGTKDLTPILQLIDEGFLHASLSEELLAQPESTWLVRKPEMLELRKTCSAANTGYQPPSSDEIRVSIDRVPSGKQAARALHNLERMRAGDTSRTIRRLAAKILKKRLRGEHVIEFMEALPAWDKCGNRTPRLCKEQIDFIELFIKEHYSKQKRLGICAAYKLYVNLAKEAHPLLPPVTRPTLQKYIESSDARSVAQGRGGRRAANAASEPSPPSERQLLATRPFQFAVIDHYLTDIHCVVVHRDGTQYTARPWITVMVDIFTGYVLAVWISFRSPSRLSCAMAVRLCVRKHGRLPEEILFDGGSDFESVYWYSLLGHCGVGPVRRPAEHPRYGSQGERFFNEFKTLWLIHRPGNTVNYDEARAVSRTHSPQSTAELTIDQLFTELMAFCEWRNANKIGLDSPSPTECVREVLERFTCTGVPVTNDDAFMIASAVDVQRYSLDPKRGLHIGELHFWHPDLRKLASTGYVEEVRKEPEDPYRVYARVDKNWITCFATGAMQFATKDPVVRVGEAIRVHEGRNMRLEAKADADQLLISKVREIDAKRVTDQAIEKAQTATQSPPEPVESVFDVVRRKPIDSIQSSKWEK